MSQIIDSSSDFNTGQGKELRIDIAIPETGCSSVFINLSNHPKEKWSYKQLKAAAAFGPVFDVLFPVINPHSTINDIRELANAYVDKIQDINASHPVTVHVMGEMTFTFSVVERLKASGIRCVASTTERNVMEKNGQKISTFEFVQFRDY